MKKIIFIAFAAILAGFAISCQKEELVSEKTEAVQYTFNITVNDQVGFDSDASTKGGSLPSYKTTWLNGDKIFLFFKPTAGSLLEDRYATLTYNGSSWDGEVSSGSSSLGEKGTLSAVYVYNLGDVTPEFSDDQWTIATGNTFYNCQTEVSYTVSGNEITASLNLVAPSDFVQFYVTSATGALTCDKVKGWKDIAIGSDLAVSNVTCTGYMDGFTNSGDSNVKEYYGRIINAGTSLENVDCEFSVVKNGKVYERTATPSTAARSFKMNASTEQWTEAKGKLPGLFKISNGTDDKEGTEDDVLVRFSQGNLWYGKVDSATTATFNFEANQYDFTPSANGDWNASHVSHFYWSNDASVACAEGYEDNEASDNDVFFTNQEGFKVSVDGKDQTGWSTLSEDEWAYLFNTRTNASGLYKLEVTVCDKEKCLIIAPDNWDTSANPLNTSYDATAWATAEAAGLVCIPAAGFRDYSYIRPVGVYGSYWSSTVLNRDFAYRVYFDSNDVGPGSYANALYANRLYGYSVRLITDVK